MPQGRPRGQQQWQQQSPSGNERTTYGSPAQQPSYTYTQTPYSHQSYAYSSYPTHSSSTSGYPRSYGASCGSQPSPPISESTRYPMGNSWESTSGRPHPQAGGYTSTDYLTTSTPTTYYHGTASTVRETPASYGGYARFPSSYARQEPASYVSSTSTPYTSSYGTTVTVDPGFRGGYSSSSTAGAAGRATSLGLPPPSTYYYPSSCAVQDTAAYRPSEPAPRVSMYSGPSFPQRDLY